MSERQQQLPPLNGDGDPQPQQSAQSQPVREESEQTQTQTKQAQGDPGGGQQEEHIPIQIFQFAQQEDWLDPLLPLGTNDGCCMVFVFGPSKRTTVEVLQNSPFAIGMTFLFLPVCFPFIASYSFLHCACDWVVK
jgi:hypothetical protein